MTRCNTPERASALHSAFEQHLRNLLLNDYDFKHKHQTSSELITNRQITLHLQKRATDGWEKSGISVVEDKGQTSIDYRNWSFMNRGTWDSRQSVLFKYTAIIDFIRLQHQIISDWISSEWMATPVEWLKQNFHFVFSVSSQPVTTCWIRQNASSSAVYLNPDSCHSCHHSDTGLKAMSDHGWTGKTEWKSLRTSTHRRQIKE